MCFSAEVSFVSAAVLLPVGVYCFKKTFDTNKSYWVFALLPFRGNSVVVYFLPSFGRET